MVLERGPRSDQGGRQGDAPGVALFSACISSADAGDQGTTVAFWTGQNMDALVPYYDASLMTCLSDERPGHATLAARELVRVR
jgi:hypothetical protein